VLNLVLNQLYKREKIRIMRPMSILFAIIAINIIMKSFPVHLKDH